MVSRSLHLLGYAAVAGLVLGSYCIAEDRQAAVVVADIAQPGAHSDLPQRAAAHGDALTRAPDGLFYVTATIKGQPVRFVVDTGATVTVLSSADAARVRLDVDPLLQGDTMNMAAGSTSMQWARRSDVSLAGHRIRDVQIALPSGDVRTSLLGQDVLSQLDAMTLRGDRLVLQ